MYLLTYDYVCNDTLRVEKILTGALQSDSVF